MWLGLALSYFLLCRASELWAYVDGKVHPEFCLTRNCLTFFRGEVQVKFENKATANSVQVRFVASTTYQKREGCTITRTRLANTGEPGGSPVGAFEVLLDLLAVHPLLPGGALLTVRRTSISWKPFKRTEAVAVLRLMIGSCGRNPAQYALHSGKNGGGNAAGGAGRGRASNPARRQVEVSRFHHVCAAGRGRGRFCLRRTC